MDDNLLNFLLDTYWVLQYYEKKGDVLIEQIANEGIENADPKKVEQLGKTIAGHGAVLEIFNIAYKRFGGNAETRDHFMEEIGTRYAIRETVRSILQNAHDGGIGEL